ncbi:hypothetical protein FACS1894188_13520 [Clostridia bacterium]|nr:hypothetical protein FACS1894188_13520 [Clostridia bacterium]
MVDFSKYADEYVKTISDGLLSTIATDKNSEVLDTNSALEIWADETQARRNIRALFFFAGNGASATMAEHLSHDCFQNADLLTYTVSETSHLTAISNDISYEDVFAFRIGKRCEARDVLITISSSGNSPNIIKAIKTARDKGMFIVTLSGKNADNKSRVLGDLNFYVPLDTYGLVESAHAALLHCWLDLFLDKYAGGRH